MAEREIAVIKNVIVWKRRPLFPLASALMNGDLHLHAKVPMGDLHFTEARVYASVTEKTAPYDNDWINEHSKEYAEIEEAELTQLGHLVLVYRGKRRFWNKILYVPPQDWFSVPDDQLSALRGVLISITARVGKVKLPK